MSSLYDRVLEDVGNDGKFQKKFDLIYNVVFSCLWVMAYNNIILALTVIPHTCQLPEKPENLSEDVWKARYIPMGESGVGKYSDCSMYTGLDTNITKACDFYDYDRTWFENTVSSENNWVCKDEINIANIFAYSRIGDIVGSLFFGWFGDVYGRKYTFIISLALLVVGRLISVIASSSFLFFTLGCIIASFPSWSATQTTSIISIEISSPKRRATVAKLRLIATSFGMCLMPFLYWWLRSWKLFLIVTTASQLPYMLYSWKLIESPQWLWINGNSKETLRYLQKIAIVNKTTLNTDTTIEMLTTSPAHSKTEVLGPLVLFSSWRIAINTILQLFLWIAVSVNYTYIIMSSGEKSIGNPFVDFAWQSLAEIPGFFVAAWLADRIGRRWTGIFSFSLTAVIWTVYGFGTISTATWLKSDVLNTILVIINRAAITVSYYIINLFNMELYPTCLRQSGMSIGNVVSGGASAFAPYILYLGRRVDTLYPSAILTTTTLLGGILSTFFLPETLNVKLPETLKDAREFGSHKFKQNNAKVNNEELELKDVID